MAGESSAFNQIIRGLVTVGAAFLVVVGVGTIVLFGLCFGAIGLSSLGSRSNVPHEPQTTPPIPFSLVSLVDEGNPQESLCGPIGSRARSKFCARNAGGRINGLSLRLTGPAVAKGIVANPDVCLSTVLGLYDLGTPTEITPNSFRWEKPFLQLNPNEKWRIATTCEMAKNGSGTLYIEVWSAGRYAPVQLLRHSELIRAGSAMYDTEVR